LALNNTVKLKLTTGIN